MATWQRDKTSGFTLIEVLVAMTIVAVSLFAALRVATLGTTHVDALRTRLFAGWVAADRLAEHHARGDWLAVGVQTGVQRQGNIDLGWREQISATPNPGFRRVDVYVFVPTQPLHFLAHTVGFLVHPARQGQ